MKTKLSRHFAAGYCDDVQTKAVIVAMWREKNYLSDPHTAVAFDVLEQYRRESGDGAHTVVVSTASPFKFCDSVLSAIGVSHLTQGTALIDQLPEVTGVPAPAPLAALKGKETRFRADTTRDHMADKVLELLD